MAKARYTELVAPEAPAPTAMAQMDSQHLFARQQDKDRCGVYTKNESKEAGTVFSWGCGDNIWCKTIGSFFGCGENVPSKCYASAENPPSTTDERQRFCTGSEFPHCWTGIKEVDGKEITAYMCARTKAIFAVMTAIESEVTKTETDDQGSQTLIVTTHPPVTATASLTGTEAEQTTSPASEEGPKAPIGAIVGGVVGGVALIALVAFGLWFIRFQKRKAASANPQADAQSPLGHPSMMQQAMYEHPYPGSQGNPTPMYHRLPADDSNRPKPKTPPPVELPYNPV